jgi:hypothetical protein
MHVYVFLCICMCVFLCVNHSGCYEKRQHKPAGDTELAGHAVHAAGPVASLYFPASHAVHVPPFGPVNPALHGVGDATGRV